MEQPVWGVVGAVLPLHRTLHLPLFGCAAAALRMHGWAALAALAVCRTSAPDAASRVGGRWLSCCLALHTPNPAPAPTLPADAHKPYAWASYLGLFAVHAGAFFAVMAMTRCGGEGGGGGFLALSCLPCASPIPLDGQQGCTFLPTSLSRCRCRAKQRFLSSMNAKAERSMRTCKGALAADAPQRSAGAQAAAAASAPLAMGPSHLKLC